MQYIIEARVKLNILHFIKIDGMGHEQPPNRIKQYKAHAFILAQEPSAHSSIKIINIIKLQLSPK